MDWRIKFRINNDEIEAVIKYCQDWLQKYDTRKLDKISIVGSKSSTTGFWGKCCYPAKRNKKSGYNITCTVHEDTKFPHRRVQRRSPLYFKKNGVVCEGAEEQYVAMGHSDHWKLGEHWSVNGGETTWVRVYEYITYYSFDECIASIFGHEIGHFLSRTKQIKYPNTEIGIDKFEDDFLNEYRKWKSQQ